MKTKRRLFWLVLLAVLMVSCQSSRRATTSPATATLKKPAAPRPFQLLTAEQLVFFNADHAPVGAYAGLMYGARGSSGGFCAGPARLPKTGLIIGLEDASGLRLLPFVNKAAVAGRADYISEPTVLRTLLACTDHWEMPGLSWTHYTPAWALADIATADRAALQRFTLPTTWMEFTVDNRDGAQPRAFYFGLPISAERQTFANGKYEGFTAGQHFLAVPVGRCELLDGDALQARFEVMEKGFAFRLIVPPGRRESLTIIIGHYRSGIASPSTQGRMYYTTLFDSPDAVVAAAAAEFTAARARCQDLDARLKNSGQNIYRQFLAGHALHSHQLSTFLLADPQGQPLWSTVEGQYNLNNTFDLSVDQVFYELAMHPWTVRNLLDRMARDYRFEYGLLDEATGQRAPGGVSFHHDMGETGSTFSFAEPRFATKYESGWGFMGQEELDNWVLCAGLYWSKTRDDAWLIAQKPILAKALASMLDRDDIDPAQRDGVTTFTTQPPDFQYAEITTYDALDQALKAARASGYLVVKNWATYLALEAMLARLGDVQAAQQSKDQADRCARSVAAHWDNAGRFVPAVFDGRSQSRIIPMVEGLAYPYVMGLNHAVSLDGPYGSMLRTLRDHLDSVLQRGVCLDSASGGWKLSSTSNVTWQSKVYLAQYVAEKILKISDGRVRGPVDQVHASFEVAGAERDGWCDQLDSRNGDALDSLHYPRGVTSALWWLEKDIRPAATQPGND